LVGERKEPLVCPFCGAPQTEIVPAGAVQLKCQYCGGIIVVPPALGDNAYRCPNHPQKLATTRCNDCSGAFCDSCINSYELRYREGGANLFLCRDCLHKRETEKARGGILVGAFVMALGSALTLLVIQPVGIFGILAGAGFLAYGFWLRSEVGKVSPEGLLASAEGPGKKPEVEDSFDVDKAYDKLLSYYVNHWGAQSGIALLEGEIRSYLLHGERFPEAVRKIYTRQERRHRKKLNWG